MDKKMMIFMVAVFIAASMIIGSSRAEASITGAAGAGWDVHSTATGIAYEYGPSMITYPNGTIDAWFCAPGNQDRWDYKYNQVGGSTAVQISGSNVAAAKFSTTYDFQKMSIMVPSYGNNVGNLTLKLFKWNTNYATTVAGTPIMSQTYINFTDNSNITAAIEPAAAAGTYVWTLSGGTESVGVWKYASSAVSGNVSYFNGAAVAGDYTFHINTPEWDAILYKHYNGSIWSADTVALNPTFLSRDHYSNCDPGAFKIGSYYYIGYSSTEDFRGSDNQVYVARSLSPTGPFEKWNGSGWGGNPQPFISYNESDYSYGAGEPSFVVKDGTIYIYYSWIGEDVNGTPTNQTRVQTALASNANWPGSMTYQGIAISKRLDTGEDSADVKYVDAYGKFLALTTSKRFGPSSTIQLYESTNGLTFYPSAMNMDNVQPYLHNGGISGTESGHIDLTQTNYVAYAYGATWANWNTFMHTITYTNDSKPAVPRIINIKPESGSARIEFATNSQATGYSVKYGTSSGVYTTTVAATTSPFLLSGLTNGTKYYIAVTATNASGTSDASKQVTATPQNFSTATIASAAAYTQLTGMEASKAIDNNMTTFYSSVGHLNDVGPEWLSYDLGSVKSVGRLTVSPRQRQGHFGAPRFGPNVKIEGSTDGTNWYEIPYNSNSDIMSFIDTDGYAKSLITLEQPVKTRYMRIYASALSPDGNKTYYLQIGDIKVEVVPWLASALSSIANMGPDNMLDADMNNFYSSNLSAGNAVTQWIALDLGNARSVSGILLKPRAGGLGFPVDFKFQSSSDGIAWTDIAGQSYTSYTNPGSSKKMFTFGSAVTTRYVRLYATKLGSEGVNYALQLSLIKPTFDKLAFTASASTQLAGWAASGITDDNPETIWSSNVHASANSSEWIKLDLGATKKISGLRLKPRDGGTAFPARFTIESSTDNVNWTVVSGQNYSKFYDPASPPWILAPNPVPFMDFSKIIDARYIRITANELRSDTYQGSSNFYFQLGDVIVE